MTYRILLVLLMALFFTGCVERGYTVKQIDNKTIFIKKSTQTSSKESSTQSHLHTVTHSSALPQKDASTFALSEETKNNISGFLIIVIGVMIFL